jgi:ubiquinone/menaquinone biosynthesis C-methylase UbiE
MALGAGTARTANYDGLFARLYDAVMWPAEKLFVGRWRRRLYGAAASAPGAPVLEIGAGTGAGFRFYAPGTEVVAVEPSAAMAARARARARAAADVTFVAASVEDLPFADGSFECAIAALTWCSVADPPAGLAEVRRVLRPHGRLLLLEHVHLAWQPGRRLQSLAAPAWRRAAQGCRLDQDTVGLLEAAGFTVQRRRDHLWGWIVELEARR